MSNRDNDLKYIASKLAVLSSAQFDFVLSVVALGPEVVEGFSDLIECGVPIQVIAARYGLEESA